MYRDQKRYGKDPTKIVRAAPMTFEQPYQWSIMATTPELVFTCSWSDFFHEAADAWRADAWEIIRKTDLTYQILTKRPENIPDRLPDDWPLPNVWLGVTAENQEMANLRIPQLAGIPAAKHFVSIEPILGPIDLGCTCWLSINTGPTGECEQCGKRRWFNRGIDWVIAGGESGPDHRPFEPVQIQFLINQCYATETPFFFKQWGGNRKIDGVWGGKEFEGREYTEIPGRGNDADND